MEPQQPAVAWTAPADDEGPAPGIRFAGHGARLVAYILDAIVAAVLVIVAVLVFGAVLAGAVASQSAGAAALSGVLLLVVILGITVAYFPWFWSRGGQTPGMRVMRIRVVRDRDGGPVSLGSAVLRLLGYYVNGVVFYIGFVWILIDKRRRGWHDLIAGTVVIEDPR